MSARARERYCLCLSAIALHLHPPGIRYIKAFVVFIALANLIGFYRYGTEVPSEH